MIRLATCPGVGLFHDEADLPAALAARGIQAEAVPWQSIEGPDAVAIRTPWDYTLHLSDFRSWLDRLDAAGAPVMNGTETIRANMDKRYLLEIEAQGHTIVPTRVLDRFDPEAVMATAIEAGWTDHWNAAIAKPIHGAGAEGLVVVDHEGVHDFDLSGNTWGTFDGRPQGPCLVQPRLDSIARGEWSLIYLGGEFSHAVLKSPRDGDIRVQEEHGATSRPAIPPQHVRLAADSIMASQEVEYARVDGVDDPRLGFALMELELIEPELFFRYHPAAVDRFADVAKAWLRA